MNTRMEGHTHTHTHTHIYIYILVLNLISWPDSTEYAGASSFSRLYDLHAGTSHSIAPLWTSDQPDEGTSTWQHNTHNRQTTIPPAGFETSIPGNEWSHTHAFDRMAAGIGYKYTDTAQLLDKW